MDDSSFDVELVADRELAIELLLDEAEEYLGDGAFEAAEELLAQAERIGQAGR